MSGPSSTDSKDRYAFSKDGITYLMNRKQIQDFLEAWLLDPATSPADYGVDSSTTSRSTKGLTVVEVSTMTEELALVILQDAKHGGPWG